MPGSDLTKRLLAEAIKECMRNKPLAKISISEIVQQCGLTRNSFYYHFKDKYDLVNWIFYTEFITEFAKREFQSFWEEFQFIFTFFYQERAFYKCAFQEEGQNSFFEYFYDVIKSSIVEEVTELFPESEDREFFANFYVDALIPCIKRWLLGDAKKTPEEMTRLIGAIVTGSATVIKKEPTQ